MLSSRTPCIVILGLAAFTFGALMCNAQMPSVPATTPASQPAAISLPTMGVSFVPPAGWTRDPNAGPQQPIRFLKFDPTNGTVVGHICVSCGPLDKPGQNLRDGASRFRANAGGTLLPEDFTIDGTPAVAVRKDIGTESNPKSLTFLTERGGLVYIFVARGARQSPNAELVTLCKSVHWIDRIAVADNIAMPPAPTSLPATGLSVRLPELFRPESGEERLGEKSEQFQIMNVETGRPLATLRFTRLGEAPPRNTDPVSHLSEALELEHITAKVQSLKAPKRGAACEFHVKESPDSKDRKDHIRYATVWNDDVSFFIALRVAENDDAHLKKWSALFDGILESLEMPAPPKTGKTPRATDAPR